MFFHFVFTVGSIILEVFCITIIVVCQEELLRLRQSAGGDGRGVARRHSYGPEKTAQVAMMPWVATAVAMALLGIIIGKFLM